MSIDTTRFQTAVQSLHLADREERMRALQVEILRHTQEMNARGLLSSSICVNGIGDLCRPALAELSAKLRDSMLRVHPSADGIEDSSFRTTFIQLLDSTFSVVEGIHRSTSDQLAAGLLNQNMIPRDQVKLEYDRLLKKYTTEIDMHLATRAKLKASTQFDTVRQRFLNRPIILISAMVIAVVLLLKG